MTNRRTMLIKAVTVAFALTFLVYCRALWGGFINLDDPFYITNNPLIANLNGASLRRIFTTPHLGAWLPLTYLSFAIDHFLWGVKPLGYHLTNVLLHAVNAGLVVLLADRLCRDLFPEAEVAPDARQLYPFMLLLAALFFAIHPLRVESVAWAAERKDVLNGFFTLTALLAYLRFAELQDAAAGRAKRLGTCFVALLLFCCSLLAKQSSVTFPVVLLLLDWYPLNRLQQGRVRGVVAEKLPFFVVALLMTLVTIHFAMAEKALISMQSMPFYVRLLVSGNAVFEYCRFTLLPTGIIPYFVLPKPLPYGYLVKTAVVVAATAAALRSLPGRRAVAVTWLAFIVLLAPMLAFVQAGDDIAMAARYTYLASIVPAIAAAAVLGILHGRLAAAGKYLAAAVIAFLLFTAAMTQQLIGVWHDTGTFWSRVIEVEPVGRAYGDRGVYYLINGRSAEAVEDFSAAIAISVNTGLKPGYNLYAFRGVGLSDTGRYVEAVSDFDRAIAIYPHPTYYYYRGLALQALGRTTDAENDLRRAGPQPPPIDWFERKQD